MVQARRIGLCVAAAAATMLPTAEARAFTAFQSPVTGQTPLVTGVTGRSPVFDFIDDGSHLFVDVGDHNMYRLGPNGGDVANAQAHNPDGAMLGLAKVGSRYYSVAGDEKIHEFDPGTLALGPALTPGFAALEPDPRTGDVYTDVGPGITRIRGLASGMPTTTVVVPTGSYSGLAFNGDATTLYASNFDTRHVFGFDRTFKKVFDVDLHLGNDSPTGIDVAPPHSTMNGVDVSDNVFVNTSAGTVVRIDVHHGNAVTTVASGGVPGDSLHFDSHGFLDSTQRTEIDRLLPRVVIRPSVLARPHISGKLRRGGTLRCVGARFRNEPATYSYSWRRAGARIRGARASTHRIVAADLDRRLTCTVTARNPSGQTSATSRPVTPQREARCTVGGRGLTPRIRCDHAARVSLRPRLRVAGRAFGLPRIAHAVRRDKWSSFRVKLTPGARRALRRHAGVLELRATAVGAGGATAVSKNLAAEKL